MTPMTRGSVMDNTQRRRFESCRYTECIVAQWSRARRDKGFEIPSTMGRYIEAYCIDRVARSVLRVALVSVFQYGVCSQVVRPRVVIPICVGSIPIRHPKLKIVYKTQS